MQKFAETNAPSGLKRKSPNARVGILLTLCVTFCLGSLQQDKDYKYLCFCAKREGKEIETVGEEWKQMKMKDKEMIQEYLKTVYVKEFEGAHLQRIVAESGLFTNKGENVNEEVMRSSQYVINNPDLFSNLPTYSYDISFALAKYYCLNEQLISKTIEGDFEQVQPILISDHETLQWNLMSEDIREYNIIILQKRKTIICNYVALMSIVYQYIQNHDEELLKDLKKLGYIYYNGNIISTEFVEYHDYKTSQIRIKDKIVINCFFDGVRIRTGKWNLKENIQEYANEDNIRFYYEESIYPLDLLVSRNHAKAFYVLSSEERSYIDSLNKQCGSNINIEKWLYDKNMCSIKIYDAIPGSGKTYTMKKNVMQVIKNTDFMLKNSNIHNYEQNYAIVLILTPTKLQKQELQEWNDQIIIKTVDSMVHSLASVDFVHSELYERMKRIHFVYIDEVFMVHSGLLRWICYNLKTLFCISHFEFYGDKGQIPYYSRTALKIEHVRDFQNEVKEIVHLNDSYRSPLDMKGFIESNYKREINMKSTEQGVTDVVVMNLDDIFKTAVIRSKRYKLLVFTQAEKDELNRYNSSLKVNTVGEAQGQTYDRVMLIRLNYYQRQIYTSKTHINVALTRHKKEILYLTVVEDELAKLITCIHRKQEIVNIEEGIKLGCVCLDSKRSKTEVEEHNKYEFDNKRNFMDQMKYEEKMYPEKQKNIYPKVNIGEEIETITTSVKAYGIYNHYLENKIEYYDQYCGRVNTMRKQLEDKGFRIDELKFQEKYKKDVERMLYEITSEDRIGGFVPSELPKSRIDEVNLLQLYESLNKRNGDVGKLREFYMTISPEEMIKNFFDTFIDRNKFEAAKERMNVFVENWEEQWFKTRTLKQMNKLVSEMEEEEINLHDYYSFVKTIVKNKFDSEQYDGFKAAQVVASAKSVLVGYFMPMVKEFAMILNSSLKPQFLINESITNEYLEWFVNDRILNSENNEFYAYEMDYAKFDKNQDWLDLYYQINIMKAFGIPEKLLSEWTTVHMSTNLVLPLYGIKANIFTQRKSGDAFTFLGNTLFTMLMFSTFHSDMQVECGLFGGDDSLILTSNRNQIVDQSENISAAFNMELKIIDTTKSISFASKFFVFNTDEQKFHVYPDILKQFSRFNRILKSKQHAYAQQISTYILDESLFTFLEGIGSGNDLDKLLEMIKYRYKIDEQSWVFMKEALISFLKLVRSGNTHLLYNEFDKVRNATKEEEEIMYMRLSKKIEQIQLQNYQPQEHEKKLIQSWNQSNQVWFKVENKNFVKKNLNVTKIYNMDYTEIIDTIKSQIWSYCDDNKINKKNIFLNRYPNKFERAMIRFKYNQNIKDTIYKTRFIKHKQTTISQLILQKLKGENRKEKKIQIVIEEELFVKINLSLLYATIDQMLYNVLLNTNVKFVLEVIV